MKASESKTTTTSHLPQAQKASQPFFSRKDGDGAFFSEAKPEVQPFFQPKTYPFLQTKLTIGQPGDKYEQEADGVGKKSTRQDDRAIRFVNLKKETDSSIVQGAGIIQLSRNTFPRTMVGVELNSEAELYEFIAQQVINRGLPFSRARVNIVGIRGLDDAQITTNPGARTRENTHNDSFFVLAMDGQNNRRVMEFPGTVDPGGRSRGHYRRRDGGSGGTQDLNTYVMGSDQQLPYRFSSSTRYKMGRETLAPIVDINGHPMVTDPHRTEIEDERREAGVANAGLRGSNERSAGIPSPRRATYEAMYGNLENAGTTGGTHDSIRTIYDESQLIGRRSGIAIHSGTPGSRDTNRVNADSTGCQVVHADWYGQFIQTIQQGLTWERMRHSQSLGEEERAQLSEGFLPDPGQLVEEGVILYSLLDGSNLTPPMLASQ